MAATEFDQELEPGALPVDPRVARSRAKVLEAATELLIEGGARAVTVDAVADRSRVAKSTMYRHFASRTELMVAVLQHNLPVVEVDLPLESFAASLRALLAEVADVLADPGWGRMLPALMSLKHTIPDVRRLTEADRTARFALVEVVLEQGKREGLVDPATEVAATVSLLIGPLMFAVLNDDTESLPALAEAVANHYLAGCRCP